MIAFSLQNADFPTLTLLLCLKLVSDCISVPSYKSGIFFLSKISSTFLRIFLLINLFCVSSIKPVPVVAHNCSVYNSSSGTSNECVHFPANNIICKTSVSLINKCTVNYRCKVLKVVLPSLSVNTVYVPLVNVLKHDLHHNTLIQSLSMLLCVISFLVLLM